ncbi:MAG: LptF/LptG family permease [Planctomycetes bacterium]|nr:LptF/LptG family permease [Planctomycetota bacterium]
MIRRLDRYVLKVFVASLAAGLLFAAGMLILTDQFQHFDDMLEAPRKLRERGHPEAAAQVFTNALRFYAYEIAIRFFQYCPFVTFFAAVFTAARLHRTNETIAILASGTSMQRAFLSVFVAAAAIAGGQLAFREWLLPTLARDQAVLRSILIEHDVNNTAKDLSVVDALSNHYTFDIYDRNARTGRGFSAYAPDAKVYKNITARELAFTGSPNASGARLTNGRYYSVTREGSRTGEPAAIAELPGEFVINAADCELAARAKEDAEYLSISELDMLARRTPNIAKYQISLHQAFTLAFANFLLPLLGLPCVLRADRRSTLEGALFAFVLCVFYFAATLFCFQLGRDGDWSTVFAAWLPTVVFGSLGIVLFESMRT